MSIKSSFLSTPYNAVMNGLKKVTTSSKLEDLGLYVQAATNLVVYVASIKHAIDDYKNRDSLKEMNLTYGEAVAREWDRSKWLLPFMAVGHTIGMTASYLGGELFYVEMDESENSEEAKAEREVYERIDMVNALMTVKTFNLVELSDAIRDLADAFESNLELLDTFTKAEIRDKIHEAILYGERYDGFSASERIYKLVWPNI